MITIEIEREIETSSVFEPYQIVTFSANFIKETDCEHDVYSDRVTWEAQSIEIKDENGKDIHDQISPDNLDWLEQEAYEELHIGW